MASDPDGTAGRYALVLDGPQATVVGALFAGHQIDGLRFDHGTVDGTPALLVDTGTRSAYLVLPDVLQIVGVAGSTVAAVREVPADTAGGPRRLCAEAFTLVVSARNGRAAI